jgi:hypothetical protein
MKYDLFHFKENERRGFVPVCALLLGIDGHRRGFSNW